MLCREDGGLFRFSLPLQDLVGVDLQPEIYFRWANTSWLALQAQVAGGRVLP